MAQVYLIGVPEDELHGEALAAWLRQRGHFVRTEFGKFGYPPSRPHEVTLAIWSRAALMSVKRIQMTNRGIDAWEAGKLVMAKYDHGVVAQGLADVEMIDLTFEAAREHRYVEIDGALRAAAAREPVTVAEEEQEVGDAEDAMVARKSARASAPKSSRGGGRGLLIAVLSVAVLAAVAFGALSMFNAPAPADRAPRQGAPVTSDVELETAGPSATIRGAVVFGDGAPDPIENCTVRLIDEATGRELAQTRTGPAGVFEFSGVPVDGSYRLTAGRGAFEAVPAEGISLTADIVRELTLPIMNAPRGAWTGDARSDAPLSQAVARLSDWRVLAGLGAGILLALALLLRALMGPRKTAAQPAVEEAAAPTPAPALPVEDEASDIFVSYAHADAKTVLPLVENVEKSGKSVWIDREDIHAGQGWAGMIVRAIKQSEHFCLMCSASAFQSNHVRREIYLADKYGKAMVPIRLDDSEMPEDIEYFLIDRHWVDLSQLSEDEQEAALRAAFET